DDGGYRGVDREPASQAPEGADAAQRVAYGAFGLFLPVVEGEGAAGEVMFVELVVGEAEVAPDEDGEGQDRVVGRAASAELEAQLCDLVVDAEGAAGRLSGYPERLECACVVLQCDLLVGEDHGLAWFPLAPPDPPVDPGGAIRGVGDADRSSAVE